MKIVNDELTEIRRYLHKFPELSGEEYKTAEYIRSKLQEFGIEYYVSANTGTVALIKGENPGKTILLRADIDALPIHEKTNVPFKSQNEGVMHACGHDIHTACLLYAGKILNSMKNNLCGNVKLVFQPKEETDGGAETMIREGVMQNPTVDAALALHVEPLEKCGFIQIKDDAVMASPDDFEIEIIGKGGHGATPHDCIDPIFIAAKIIELYNQIPAKYFSAQVPCVVSICSINGGNCSNVIPDNVQLLGTARSLDENTREKLICILKEIAEKTSETFGGKCKFKYNKCFPPTINDSAMNKLVVNASKKIKDIKGITYLPYASMCGDDFAYFSRLVPSSYFKLGVGTGCNDFPIHSPDFFADEKSLSIGVSLLVQSVLDYTSSKQ